MLGNTYPMFGIEKTLSDRLADRDLANYLRWEYRPADRVSVILSARGGTLLGLWGRKPARKRTLLRRFRVWVAAHREPRGSAAAASEASTGD